MSKLYIKCVCGFKHEVQVQGYTKIICPKCDDIMEYYWDYDEDIYSVRRYNTKNRRRNVKDNGC